MVRLRAHVLAAVELVLRRPGLIAAALVAVCIGRVEIALLADLVIGRQRVDVEVVLIIGSRAVAVAAELRIEAVHELMTKGSTGQRVCGHSQQSVPSHNA